MPRRQVRDPDGGIRLVDVLSAGALRRGTCRCAGPSRRCRSRRRRRATGAAVRLREGGVPAVVLVERRQADEPVDALLGLDDAVRVVALERERGRLDAGLLARCRPRSAPALKPRCSAQRRYMRSSISAQSWASVPPAPALTCTTAGPASYSPVNSAASWSASISPRTRRTLSASSVVSDASSSASSTIVGRSSSSRARRSNRSSSRASFARSALTLPAARVSSQNPGAEISVSSSSMRERSASGSKVITDPDEPGPQLLDGGREILGFLGRCGRVGHGRGG